MSFLAGFQAGSNFYFNSRALKRQDQLDERNDKRYNEQLGMERERTDSQLNLQRIQSTAYEREMQRKDDDADRAQTLARLAGFHQYIESGGDDPDAMQLFLTGLNAQDKDLIDPMGDGREVVRMNLLHSTESGHDGRWVLDVAGGGVNGVQPVTKKRGTAAEGDNSVHTVTSEELFADQMGQLQAFKDKYGPDVARIVEDPKARTEFLRRISAEMTSLGGTASGLSEKRDIEALKHTNKMEEIEAQGKNAREKSSGSAPQVLTVAKEFQANYKENGQPVSYERAVDLAKSALGHDTSGEFARVLVTMMSDQKARGTEEGDPGYMSIDQMATAAQQAIQKASGGTAALQPAGGNDPAKAQYVELPELPDAAAAKGKKIQDTQTNKYYRSDGTGWLEVQ